VETLNFKKIGLCKLLQIGGWCRNILVLIKFGVAFAGQTRQIIFSPFT